MRMLGEALQGSKKCSDAPLWDGIWCVHFQLLRPWHPAGQLPAFDWLTAPSFRHNKIWVSETRRHWGQCSGSGTGGWGGGGRWSGSVSGLGKFPLPMMDSEGTRPSVAPGPWKWLRPQVPPLSPTGPGNHGEMGKWEEPANQGWPTPDLRRGTFWQNNITFSE